MKKLKYFIAVFMLSFVFNVSAQKTLMNVDGEPVKTKLTFKQQEYLKGEFRKGMDSFVESVKPFYKSGMSYNQFELALVGGTKSLMPIQGKNLLEKAYKYLSNSTKSRTILSSDSGKEIAAALIFIKQTEYKNKGVDASYSLFGKSQGEKFPNENFMSKRKCKWYQIGCHLSNAWDWIVDNIDNIIKIVNWILTL